MGQDATEIRREIEATRARMGDTVEAIGYKADVPARLRDSVNDRIESVKGTINNAVSGTKSGAQDQVQRATDSTRQAVSLAVENPLGLVLGALAVGFLGGLMLPVSDIEREQIGPVREQIAQRAGTVVAEAVEAGKTVLNDTLAAATQSAQQHGKDVMQHAVAGTPLEAEAEPASSTGA